MTSRRSLQVVLACTFIALSACHPYAAPMELSPAAANVRTGKGDAPAGYVEMGPITAVHGSGCGSLGSLGSYEGAMNELRNQAARIGATFIRIDLVSEPHQQRNCFNDQFVINGVAYRPGV